MDSPPPAPLSAGAKREEEDKALTRPEKSLQINN